MLEERAKRGAGTTVLRSGLATVLILAACSLEVNVDLARDDGDVETAPAVVDAQIPPSPSTVEAPEASVEEVVIPPVPPPVRVEPPAQKKSRGELEASPTFTPFTVAPSIVNREEVVRSMEASYPPLLREAGVGGTVRVYFFIDETGRVAKTLIDQSSGHPALDDAAMRVAGVYRFSPALNKDQKVPVWVSFPITFQVR